MTILFWKGIGKKMQEFDETLETLSKQASSVDIPSFNIRINHAGADVLTKDIMEYSRLANNSLSSICSIIENSAEFFKCSSGDKLRTKFRNLAENFPILIQNMENYALSIKKAERLYNDHADLVVSNLNKSIADMDMK